MTYPRWLLRWLVRSGLVRFLPGMDRQTEGATAYLHHYSRRVQQAPRADLQRLQGLLEGLPPDALDLGSGSPRFATPLPDSPRGLGERAGWPPPQGLPELRTAVAEHLLLEAQLPVSAVDEVLITHGALGAFQVALQAFVNRGDAIVLFDPTAPLFPVLARAHGARVRWLRTGVEQGLLRFHLDELERGLRGARMLVLVQPGNPTGASFSPDDLEQIAYWAERQDVLLLCDESYRRFLFEGDLVSPATLGRARARTLTVGSVSKSHGLASLRVGWVVGPRALVRPCLLTSVLSTPFVPTVCQQLAASALRQAPDSFQGLRSELAQRRGYAFERVQHLGLPATWPAGGWYLWVPVWPLGMSGAVFAERFYQEQRVRVLPGDLFGPQGAGYVRLSFALDEGRLREGLHRLGEFVRGVLHTVPQAIPLEAPRQAA